MIYIKKLIKKINNKYKIIDFKDVNALTEDELDGLIISTNTKRNFKIIEILTNGEKKE